MEILKKGVQLEILKKYDKFSGFLAQMMNFLVSRQKMAIFFTKTHLCRTSFHVVQIVFWRKMPIFDHNPFVHSFFLCGLDLVFQHKMAIFDHNPFVHSFFLASKLHNFVSYLSIDCFDGLTWEKNVVLIKILENNMEFSGFTA